jgi:hypothetical protein
VQASARLEATVPLGDGESPERLRERTDDTATRPARATAAAFHNAALSSAAITSHYTAALNGSAPTVIKAPPGPCFAKDKAQYACACMPATMQAWSK